MKSRTKLRWMMVMRRPKRLLNWPHILAFRQRNLKVNGNCYIDKGKVLFWMTMFNWGCLIIFTLHFYSLTLLWIQTSLHLTELCFCMDLQELGRQPCVAASHRPSLFVFQIAIRPAVLSKLIHIPFSVNSSPKVGNWFRNCLRSFIVFSRTKISSFAF